MTTPGTKTRSHASATGPSVAYLALVRRFPLRPLRTAADYEKAASILDALAVRPEGSLVPGEQDYLDTLTLLVQAYDDEHHEFTARAANPLAMLKIPDGIERYAHHGAGTLAGKSRSGFADFAWSSAVE